MYVFIKVNLEIWLVLSELLILLYHFFEKNRDYLNKQQKILSPREQQYEGIFFLLCQL